MFSQGSLNLKRDALEIPSILGSLMRLVNATYKLTPDPILKIHTFNNNKLIEEKDPIQRYFISRNKLYSTIKHSLLFYILLKIISRKRLLIRVTSQYISQTQIQTKSKFNLTLRFSIIIIIERSILQRIDFYDPRRVRRRRLLGRETSR